MADYTIEEKDSFTVSAFGTELTSDYTDFAGINKEKMDFWQSIQEDGTLHTLTSVATNNYVFTVNEAVNNKMMHYAGVMTDASLPDATRIIQFPKGKYVVVKGEANTAYELSESLTGITFGEVLPKVENFAYVGGPNTAVKMGERNGIVYGEMWIPVVEK